MDRDVIVYILSMVATKSSHGAIGSARQHIHLFAPQKFAFAVNAVYALCFFFLLKS